MRLLATVLVRSVDLFPVPLSNWPFTVNVVDLLLKDAPGWTSFGPVPSAQTLFVILWIDNKESQVFECVSTVVQVI